MDSYDSHTEGERILVDLCGFILAQKLLYSQQSTTKGCLRIFARTPRTSEVMIELLWDC